MTSMKKKPQIYLNSEDVQKINDELKYLIEEERAKVIEEIKEARKQGDLSENAEYDSAKQKQSIVEERIHKLRNILKYATLIDQKLNKNPQAIRINSVVKLLNLHDQSTITLKIGTISELNVEKRIISSQSPLAKSIFGHKVNDEVVIKGIRNTYKAKILSVKNN